MHLINGVDLQIIEKGQKVMIKSQKLQNIENVAKHETVQLKMI